MTPAFSSAVGGAIGSLGTNYFAAAHPDATLTDAAQLLPFLRAPEKLVAAFRPIFAQLDYAAEHEGRMPTSPEQWQPYLARPFIATEAFKAMRLRRDGDGLDMDLDFTSAPRRSP